MAFHLENVTPFPDTPIISAALQCFHHPLQRGLLALMLAFFPLPFLLEAARVQWYCSNPPPRSALSINKGYLCEADLRYRRLSISP